VRIPREFELPGEDAIIRKEGDRLIIEPTPPPTCSPSTRTRIESVLQAIANQVKG